MFCFVKDCKLSRRFRTGAKDAKGAYLSTFIKFPKDETLFKKWLKALGVQNDSVIKWHDQMYLCSGHFKDEDYIEKKIGDNKVIVQLKRDTVPTYLPLPPNYKPANKTNTKTAILESALTKPNENKSTIPLEKTNGQTDQPIPPTNEIINNAIKKFFEGGTNSEESNTTKRYFQPRYMKDVELSDLTCPRKAKICLNIAKRTLEKQSNKIKWLKSKNRVLYKKLDKLQQLLNYTMWTDKQEVKGEEDARETITVLVNI